MNKNNMFILLLSDFVEKMNEEFQMSMGFSEMYLKMNENQIEYLDGYWQHGRRVVVASIFLFLKRRKIQNKASFYPRPTIPCDLI